MEIEPPSRQRRARRWQSGATLVRGVRESDFAMPYSASMRWDFEGAEVRTVMVSQTMHGGCARCHALPAASARFEDFRIDPPNADYVFPAGPIFPPGLYP